MSGTKPLFLSSICQTYKIFMMKNFERNAEIWRLYKENRMTLAAIGRMFNLSRQRVYQIVQAKKELVEHTKNWDKPFV